MDKNHPSLSVVLAVYNEEANLGECLSSIKDIASEIIVVDGESTDQTVAIAHQYHAKVISTQNRANFHINKTMAIDAATSPWILQLDADERVSSMLASEIISTISSNAPASAYYLKRRNYFLGRWMNKGGMYPDPVIRLFQAGKAHLPQASVHELMSVNGPTAWLKNDLLHIADPTFARYLMRSNRYTTLQAESDLKNGTIDTSSLTIFKYMILKPIGRFFSLYLRHKGYQDGFPGFVFAFYSGLHIASSYVKYWEKKTTNTTIDLKKDWN